MYAFFFFLVLPSFLTIKTHSYLQKSACWKHTGGLHFIISIQLILKSLWEKKEVFKVWNEWVLLTTDILMGTSIAVINDTPMKENH